MAVVVRSAKLSNGVKIPFLEHGDSTGVPMVLLHAIADSLYSFEGVLRCLPDSIHAFAPTQRGHGDASRPAQGYRPRDFAEDLAAFMDALHLEAAVIAGGSSGGFVARRFAINYPKRTLGLVLLGSPATLADNPAAREIWSTAISKLSDPVDPTFVRGFVEGTISQAVPQAFVEAMVQESLKVPARVWRATFEGLLEDDAFHELNKVTVPTLIVWGDQDTFLPRVDQDALKAAIPGSRLVVYPGAGHALYWEEPGHVASDLSSFVEELGK